MKKKEGKHINIPKICAMIALLVLSLHTFFFSPLQMFASEERTETTNNTYKETSSATSNDLENSESLNAGKTMESTDSITESHENAIEASDEKETKKKMDEKEDVPVEVTDPEELAKIKAPSLSFMAEDKVEWEGEYEIKESNVSYGTIYIELWSNNTARVVNGKKIVNNAVITIPSVLSWKEKNYSMIEIGLDAFKENTKLKTLKFKSGSPMQIIKSSAFYKCENLSGVLDFSNCKDLAVIEEEAFRGCVKLSSLKFGNDTKVRSMGKYAFRDCEGFGGKSITIPDSMLTFGDYTFMNTINPYKELHHKKIAAVNGTLPSLAVDPIDLPAEAEDYESKVNSSREKTLLHKAAKWTNDERTEAEIRIDYGHNFERIANVDIVFVMDYSSSMLIPTKVKKNNVTYNYPRAYLTNDIVQDASKMLLDNSPAEYDNRVALVAFGGEEKPLYSSGFMETSQQVKDHIIKSPACWNTETKYDTGLQGALDLFKKYPEPNREKAVIFLSDGIPNQGKGLVQAKELREKGINVYPIAMYSDKGTPEALKKIAHDEKTAYVADDTDSFEKIMADVVKDVINHAEPLTVKLEDVLGKDFELPSGAEADFELSPDGGSVSVSADKRKITWDLSDCAEGVAHTLKIKLRVEEGKEFETTGILDTNDSLEAISTKSPIDPAECLVTTEQPKLDRYLAHFEFKNETFPNKELPEEIRKLLPPSKGGFADNTLVKADKITDKVQTKEGQWWEFLGWDKEEETIVGKDVLFTGKWRYVGYDFSFIKQNEDGEGLSDAEFSLYAWKGGGTPGEKELVTEESVAAGKWKLIGTQTSGADGRVSFPEIPVQEGKYYQLVETKAPFQYRKPQGQWRFALSAEDGFIENDKIIALPGADDEELPEFEKIQTGEHQGMWRVINKHAQGELPATGGSGTAGFAIGAMILGSIGVSGLGGFYLYNHKRE